MRLKNATAIRQKEYQEFSAKEAELMDCVDTLERAITVISQEMKKTLQHWRRYTSNTAR